MSRIGREPLHNGGWPSDSYTVEVEDLVLTNKQVEAALIALDLGYYNGPPREAEQRDVVDHLADVVDPSAVSARLRRVECRTLRRVLREILVEAGCPLCRDPRVRLDADDRLEIVPLGEHLPECPKR